MDLEPGAWTKFKIEVDGRKARLDVHGSRQPCLIVNDLENEPVEGSIALWAGVGREGYFSRLRVKAR
ncbi:MAG: hypothetical protein U0Q16_23775 [Bryobacteraceae bacterium]